MDVICVFDALSQPHCTEFHVKFRSPVMDQAAIAVLGLNEDTAREQSTDVVFPDVGNNQISDCAVRDHNHSQPSNKCDFVQITCNDRYCPDIIAFIGLEQFLYFFDNETSKYSKTPSMNMLKKFDLQLGRNVVRCVHNSSNTYKEFNIWRYERTDCLVVMDIDGTITKSDITGYIQTVYMGLFSYIHEGIVPFLNTLKDSYHYHIVYLTARPLIHQKETKQFLDGIRDENGIAMPDGPLFPSKDRIFQALYREMVSKTTMQLKTSIMNEIMWFSARLGVGKCPRLYSAWATKKPTHWRTM